MARAKKTTKKETTPKKRTSARPTLLFSRPGLGAVVALGPEGVVVATRTGGELLDLATGATVATLPGLPAARTDHALIIVAKGKLQALDAATRAARGPLDLPVDDVLGAPDLRTDGDELLAHAGGSTFALWDLAKRPARSWSVQLEPAFAPRGRAARTHVGGLHLDGDLAVVARRHGPSYGLDRATGEERWRLDGWALAVDDRGLVALDEDGRLAAIDRRGRRRWTAKGDDLDEPLLGAGLVAAGRSQDTLLLDRATGAVRGRVRGTPVAGFADLLLVAEEGRLRAIGPDGQARWTHDLGAGKFLERLLVVDDLLVGHLEGGTVFALRR